MLVMRRRGCELRPEDLECEYPAAAHLIGLV